MCHRFLCCILKNKHVWTWAVFCRQNLWSYAKNVKCARYVNEFRKICDAYLSVKMKLCEREKKPSLRIERIYFRSLEVIVTFSQCFDPTKFEALWRQTNCWLFVWNQNLQLVIVSPSVMLRSLCISPFTFSIVRKTHSSDNLVPFVWKANQPSRKKMTGENEKKWTTSFGKQFINNCTIYFCSFKLPLSKRIKCAHTEFFRFINFISFYLHNKLNCFFKCLIFWRFFVVHLIFSNLHIWIDMWMCWFWLCRCVLRIDHHIHVSFQWIAFEINPFFYIVFLE